MLLVGGSSRIPLVAQMVSEQLGRPVAVDADPKNAIAKGAALSLTPAGISATGAYPPAPRGHGSGPLQAPARRGGRAPGHRLGPFVARAAAAQPGAFAAAAVSAEDFTPTQRMSSPRPHGPARCRLPGRRCRSYEPDDVEYSYAPPQQRRSPAALVGAGGAAAAVAVLVMVFLWPRPAVSTASLDTAPTVAATTRRRTHHRGRPRPPRVAPVVPKPPPVRPTRRRAAGGHDDGGSAAHHHGAAADDHDEAGANQLGHRRHHHDVIDETGAGGPDAPNVAPFRVSPSPRVTPAAAARD